MAAEHAQSDDATQDDRQSALNQAWDSVEGAYHGAVDKVSQLSTYRPTEAVQQAPFTASLVSFGVGIGLGLLLAQLLTPPPRRRRWYDSYLGEDRAAALEHSMHRYLPSSVSRRMGV